MNQTKTITNRTGGNALYLPVPDQGRATPDIPSKSDDVIDLQKLLGTLWRAKFWMLLFGILGAGLGLAYILFLAVPTYTASASVAFESREEQVVDLESVVGGLGGDQATINTEVEVLRSRNLMAELVEKLDLTADPEFNFVLRPEPTVSVSVVMDLIKTQVFGPQPEPEPLTESAILDEVIDEVLRHVSISNVRQSYVFRITVVTEDPEKSAQIANNLAELYIRSQVQVKYDATEQATVWLSERVTELQSELEQSVEAVKQFNVSSQLISSDVLEALNRQIKDLRDRQRDARTARDTVTSEIARLLEVRSTGDLDAMEFAAQDRALSRTLQRMKSAGAVDNALFLNQFDGYVDRLRQDQKRTEDQAVAYSGSISRLEEQVALQSDDLVKLQQLEREAEASRLIYEYFLGRLKETSVQQGIHQADSRVLSNAVVPRKPSAPSTTLTVAAGFAVGLFLCAALAVARELAQNTYRSATELEESTGHTVLGQIPLIPSRRRKNVLRYLADKPSSSAAEAVRDLRTSTLLSNVDHTPQIIMSTSSLPGEGKTTQSLALAQNLSGMGKKVLLIEGDIRRRVFREYFDIQTDQGLLSVLADKAELRDAVTHVAKLGADVLVGEKSRTNAADVFSSVSFQKFLTAARNQYDFIIIDTPPVLLVPDARVIGQHVDAILYSVKWNQTTKRQVISGLRSFETVNVAVTGLVLSQINPKGMKRYGYGGYGEYARHSHGYYQN